MPGRVADAFGARDHSPYAVALSSCAVCTKERSAMEPKPLPDLPEPWEKVSASVQRATWEIDDGPIVATVALDAPRSQCTWDLVGTRLETGAIYCGTARTMKAARSAAEKAVVDYKQQLER